MAVTLTIKQVPEKLAQKLRTRALEHHRSLQGELLHILHEALQDNALYAAEPDAPAYAPKRASGRKVATHGRRLTLGELWARSRRLGKRSRSESASIVRQLRDERHRR